MPRPMMLPPALKRVLPPLPDSPAVALALESRSPTRVKLLPEFRSIAPPSPSELNPPAERLSMLSKMPPKIEIAP